MFAQQTCVGQNKHNTNKLQHTSVWTDLFIFNTLI